jgi:hypothetical protein
LLLWSFKDDLVTTRLLVYTTFYRTLSASFKISRKRFKNTSMLRRKPSKESGTLQLQIKLALDKAQEYYAKLDDSSAYLAATVLQPAKGWKFVEGLWRTQSTWLADGKDALLDMWATYKQQPISEAMSRAKKPQRQLNVMKQYRAKGMSEARNNPPPIADEFQRYCEQAQVETDSPLRWWREIVMTKYPHLAQMAFDVLSIPAMSDEPERIFSRMGIMITKRRNHLEQDIIQATQCLYSWDKAEFVDILHPGIIAETPSPSRSRSASPSAQT